MYSWGIVGILLGVVLSALRAYHRLHKARKTFESHIKQLQQHMAEVEKLERELMVQQENLHSLYSQAQARIQTIRVIPLTAGEELPPVSDDRKRWVH